VAGAIICGVVVVMVDAWLQLRGETLGSTRGKKSRKECLDREHRNIAKENSFARFSLPMR
jgi:hypothetical protein